MFGLALMKKLFTNKTVVIVLGIISILVLVYVSAGFSSLQFQQGKPFSARSGGGGEAVVIGRLQFPLYYMILCAVGLLTILTIFALIVMPPKKRWLLLLLLALMIVAFFVIGYLSSQPQVAEPTPTPAFTSTPAQIAEDVGTPVPTVIPSEFTPPKVSSWTSYLVALAATVALAIGAWLLLTRQGHELPELKDLAEIAQATLDDLQDGKDWGNTIEGCYFRMTDTIQKRRGLKRRIHMTPAEFAIVLEKTGLPGASIRRLTALFERVRYGGKKSTQKDVEEAVACMTEIVDACQEAENE
jgi:Ca2+/Na+ antiporter